MKSLAVLICVVVWTVLVNSTPVNYKYGVMMDCGSSGTRIYVYRWQENYCDELPEMTEIFSLKKKPGVSQYIDRLDELPEYIGGLVEEAKEYVPVEKQAETNIYAYATAGLRTFSEADAETLLDAVRDVLDGEEVNPFHFKDRQVKILSGEEEATFAWVAVNFQLGNFKAEVDPRNTAGITEMGGASMQITFVPDGPIYDGMFRVVEAERVYDLYAHSFMSYGQDMFGDRIAKYVSKSSKVKFSNPCILKGDNRKVTIDGRDLWMRGAGNPEKCAKIVEGILRKAKGDACSPKQCSIGSQYQPSIPEEEPFYALSAYFYTPDTLSTIRDDGSLDIPLLRKTGEKYCKLNLQEAIKLTGESDPTHLSQYCMMSIYIPMLLTKSFGFDENTHQIKVTKEIGGSKIDWTMGALLDLNSLHGDCIDRGQQKRTLRVKRK